MSTRWITRAQARSTSRMERHAMKNTEQTIIELAQLLAVQCKHIHRNCDWPKYTHPEIQLHVGWSPDAGPTLKLLFVNPRGADVSAKSLDALIMEVKHRLDFDDKEAGKEPLKALTHNTRPAPPFRPVNRSIPA